MMLWLAGWGRQVWGWVALVAAALVGALALYRKGHKDARTQAEVAALENEVEARRASSEVRRAVGGQSDAGVADGLRAWTRPGS